MEPLRIAVIGLGGIGSTFAFQLARVGHHDVTAIARPGSPRLGQLERDRGIVDRKGERADVRVSDTLDETIAYDLVLVTLLAHQVDAVLPALGRSAAKSIQFMFNTFEPERLRDAVGTERASFGMPFVQATVDPEGRLVATIGAGGQKCIMAEPRWVDVFVAAGLPATFEPRMIDWLRCHAPLCVAFESVSFAGVRSGKGASFAQAMDLARGVHEGFVLIRALGFPIYPSAKRWMDKSPAWALATMLWSVSRIKSFRELLATGVGECRALVDAMVAAAARANATANAKASSASVGSGGSVNAAKLRAMKPAET